MTAAIRQMKPVGPKASAFIASTAFITGIMGPVGGGKTVAGIARCFRLAHAQRPVWDEGRRCYVKRCRIAAVRDTYPNLDRTLIKTWHQWVPKEIGKWSGEAPRTHNFTINVGRPGQRGFHQIDMEMIFTAIGDHSVEDVLRGFELTGLWGNEWDLLPPDLLEFGVGRVGRYPAEVQGGCSLAQIWGDFNAPDEDNHMYSLFVDKKIDPELAAAIAEETGGDQKLIEFFEQPGGLDPGAENLHNLKGGRNYYIKQAALMSPDKKRRMVDNKFGAVRDGMPVYPEFSNSRHVTDPDIQPIKGVALRIGMDAGLTPAAVIAQRNQLGQTIVLAELATFLEEDDQLAAVGPTAFGEALADMLASRFPGFPVEFAAVDPAATKGVDGTGNELSWLQTAAKVSKLKIRPAPVPNNDLTIRLEAVRRPLTKILEGDRPALVISPACKILRRGFNSGYKYRRTMIAGKEGRYDNKPVKNQFSHVHDALQYLMVASGWGRMSGAAVGGGRADYLEQGGRSVVTVDADYDPFGS
ncbi:hypothetical protein [Sphingopyxis terrae]|uniref:hypothetical protein n=1 Tax=Sphingopyxis terrae TaxID=33052 RepID=UPI003F801424